MEHLNRRLPMANLPTPLQKMEAMTRILGGPDIYIKRDDLTGIALSGNKIRKLEYCAASALDSGCDMLITCGGIQSNHARATAAVAAKLNMKCHLVLTGSKPEESEGNYFLDQMFEADFTYAEGYGLAETGELLSQIAEDYLKKGFTPYIIPLGASDSTGSLGYIKAVSEMKDQFNSLGFEPDHIICPTGSAGTLSGLHAGKDLFSISSKITGFSVAFDRESVKSKVLEVLDSIRKDYFPDLKYDRNDIHVNDNYIGEGYTCTTTDQLSLIREVAAREAIIFDPTYTGKAFYGLAQEIQKGTFKKGETVLFLHTGGVFGLFPYRERLSKEIF